ncbi:outer membrane biogenesis protein BamB [Caulifigura coniformis]|uniref:Outer membrane biogenesis protein BamB n=1 Tax=Caulifigura coniformis TaxID=2527983 RepID=A0A517SHN4_9PLAN|nr:PQQ-binding-like beta-propeller repeat protein [Caulifigura coniformis]QDT55638.1 outer membrane biogenesis protein BamB [Caulifigura coniformis]
MKPRFASSVSRWNTTIAFFVCAFPALLAGADWPQWGGSSRRNMSSAEKGLPDRFDPGKRRRNELGFDPETTRNVKWIARLGAENYSAASVADGHVVIGTNDEELNDPRFEPTGGGVLKCFDEETGALEWQLISPKLEIDRSKVSEDFDAMDLGICATPTIEDGRVYVVTNRCEVLCLDLDGQADGNDGPFVDEAKFSVPNESAPVPMTEKDADIVWRYDMLRELPVFPHDAANCSVLVHEDELYVGTANGVYDGKMVLPTAASLIALDKSTGTLRARDDGSISAGVFHGQWSSPTLASLNGRDIIIYGGGDGVCYAFEPIVDGVSGVQTLKLAWKYDCNPPGYRERGGKKIDYWALVRGGPKDLDANGDLYSPSEIIGSPVVSENRIYVTIGQDPLHGHGRGAITCLNADGTLAWQTTEIGRSLSTPSVADGLLYCAEWAGQVHCLDIKTGEHLWTHDTKEEIWSSTFVADGKVYVGTRKFLAVLAAGPSLQHIADVKLVTPVWAVPSAANGVLYVSSQKNLWAVRKEKELPEMAGEGK